MIPEALIYWLAVAWIGLTIAVACMAMGAHHELTKGAREIDASFDRIEAGILADRRAFDDLEAKHADLKTQHARTVAQLEAAEADRAGFCKLLASANEDGYRRAMREVAAYAGAFAGDDGAAEVETVDGPPAVTSSKTEAVAGPPAGPESIPIGGMYSAALWSSVPEDPEDFRVATAIFPAASLGDAERIARVLNVAMCSADGEGAATRFEFVAPVRETYHPDPVAEIRRLESLAPSKSPD